MSITLLQPFNLDTTANYTFNEVTVSSNVNMSTAGNVTLGNVSNVHITGGTANYVLQTDGAGNLSWVEQSGGGGTPGGSNTQIQFNDDGSFAGNANLTFDKTTSVLSVTGNISALNANLGNSVIANYFSGSGNLLSNIQAANVTGAVANATHAVTANTVVDAAQSNITSVGTLTGLTSNGTINFTNASNVSLGAVGNVKVTGGTNGQYLTTDGAGNLSFTTLSVSSSSISNGNSNVNIPVANGNVNISSEGNANVVVVTGTGINVSGTINATGNLTAGNITTSGSGGNLTGANYVIANFFSGSGNNLSNLQAANITGTIANANYALYAGTLLTNAQPNITSVGTLTDLNVSGNAVFGGNLTVDGSLVYVNVTDLSVEDPIIQLQTGPNAAAPTSNSGKDIGTALNYYDTSAKIAFMGWDVSNAEFAFGNTVSISSEVVTFSSYGNIRAGYFIGNGSQLTGITSAAYANYISNGTSNVNILTADGNVTVSVNGNANIVTVTGTGTNIAGTLNATGNANVGNIGATNGVFTNVSGNGSSLSSLTGANVTGQVANAIVAGTVYTAAQPNITSVGLLTSLSIGPNSSLTLTGTSGYIRANSIQGTDGVNALYPAYDGVTGAVGVTSNLTVGIGVAGNITANGTINFTSASNVSLGPVGNVKITGGTANYVLQTDGAGNLSWVAQSGGGGSPGGSNTQIQFNDDGSFAGNAGLTFNKTNTTLTANNFIATSTANLGNVGNVIITGGTSGYVLSTDGAGNLSWVAGGGGSGGANITNNTTANTTYYPVYATATSGSFTVAGISTTKLQFNPSSGQLTVQDLNTLSDATLKENPEIISDPFEILTKLFGMGFTWADTGKKSYGLLAQMLEQVLPELVSENAQGKKTVNYIPIIAFLIEAVKKLQTEVEAIKKR